MTDGITITGLAISGTALTALGGIVGSWLRARYGRTEITPQPLEVRTVLDHTVEQLHQNRDDHSNIFSRLSENEKRIASLEAYQKSQGEQLNRIDNKLDKVLEELRK
jgi:hypothetical protein